MNRTEYLLAGLGLTNLLGNEQEIEMAGSLNHIVDAETGKLRLDLIENLRDAAQALDECFHLIAEMTGGDMTEVNQYCDALGYPRIRHDMVPNAKIERRD